MENGDKVRVNDKDVGVVHDYNPKTGFSLRTETAWVVYPYTRRKNRFWTWLFSLPTEFAHDYKIEVL
jgi:hypothetical protein